MRRIYLFLTEIVLGILLVNAWAADIVLESHAQDFINNAEKETVPDSANLEVEGIRNGPRCTSRPVRFRVGKPSEDETEMMRLAQLVGMEVNNDPVKRGKCEFLESSDETARIGYHSVRGRYTYYNNALEKEPLSKTDSAALDELRQKADVLMPRLVNYTEREFVFANQETDWYQTKEDTTHRISKRSFRYTRKVNGRHVIDQAAHVRITYSADGRVCAFSIENPMLVPENFPHMVKLSATEARLRRYAVNKKTAVSPEGRIVAVSKVCARRVIPSYIGRTIGETEYLVPQLSVLTQHVLDNGKDYSGYLHLSLDGSEVPNLDAGMMEGGSR